jgi:DNA replication protein DnaC
VACALCDGSGWKPAAEGTRRVARCDCWREALTARLLEHSRIPPRYRCAELETFATYGNDALTKALGRARRFAEEFPGAPKGLCFIGPTGIGKTHLAATVLRRVILTRGARGLFYDTRDLLRLIRSTYNPQVRTAEMDILRPVMEADVLVLDDLGSEKPTEWVEETMTLIVNTRYNERRHTIVTSNYDDPPEDRDHPDSLKARIGFRMHSRLHEMCDVVEFDGADYRLGEHTNEADLKELWRDRKAQGPQRRARPRRPHILTPVDGGRRELGWSGGKVSNHHEDPK